MINLIINLLDRKSMRDIDTQLLRTFLSLSKTKSFTDTAYEICRSQAAVSQQIAKLEKLLSVSLFERQKNNLTLTRQGKKLIAPASEIVQQVASLYTHAADDLQISGEVKVGVPEDFATIYLPQIIADFSVEYPEIALTVNCDLTLNLQKAYKSGEYDLVILKQEPCTLKVNQSSLTQEKIVWVTNFQFERETAFAEIKSRFTLFPLILSPFPCVYRTRAIKALEAKNIKWHIKYISPSCSGLIAAVRAGLGVAILPANSVPSDLQSFEGGKHQWPKLEPVEMILQHRVKPNYATQLFAEFISDKFMHKFFL